MITIRSRSSRPAQLGAVIAASALLLAACSSPDDGAEPEATPGDSAEAPAGEDLAGSSFSMGVPITESGDSPYKIIAEAYMEEFPDREVLVNELPNDGFAQALRTQLQAGNADDVIYVTPGGGNPQALLPFVEAGYIEPLTGTSAESTIPESNMPAFEFEGDIYAQALDLTVVGGVSNQSAKEADGFENPATYDELLEACASVPEGKSVYVVGGAMPPNTGLTAMVVAAPFVYEPDPEWNAKRVAGEVTFAESKGWQDALHALVELNEAGCFQEGVEGGDFSAITNRLGTGDSYTGFIPAGAAFQLGVEVPDATFVVEAFPGISEDSTMVYASANNALAVTAGAENKDAAMAFLDWLAQPEMLKQYAAESGNLPVGELTAEDLPEQYAPVADYLIEGRYQRLPSAEWTNGEVYTALGTGVQGLFTGQTTVEDILTAMDAAWDS